LKDVKYAARCLCGKGLSSKARTLFATVAMKILGIARLANTGIIAYSMKTRHLGRKNSSNSKSDRAILSYHRPSEIPQLSKKHVKNVNVTIRKITNVSGILLHAASTK
jgi:hypothetical protein